MTCDFVHMGWATQTASMLHVDVAFAGKRHTSPVWQSLEAPQFDPASRSERKGPPPSSTEPPPVAPVSSFEQAKNAVAAATTGSARRKDVRSQRMR
jgi:hypothetical protein